MLIGKRTQADVSLFAALSLMIMENCMREITWKKEIIGQMHRCYSVQTACVDGKQMLLAASEAEEGGMAAYSADAPYECTWISRENGGTMSIVNIPGASGVLYVGRKFYPHFEAAESDVICCRKTENGWEETVVLRQPYLHRFDVFQVGDKRVFVGCSLCGSKRFQDDWSDPGAIYVGYLQEDPAEPFSLKPILEGVLKNHGYWRGRWQGKEAGFIAAENGVYVFTPGEALTECTCVRILDQPVSEVAMWDFDADGVDEMAIISPMHGNQVSVLHADSDGGYREVYRCPLALEFCHALWAGAFCGVPTILCGARRREKQLFCITYSDGGYSTAVIDTQVGSANVCVYSHAGEQRILSANNGCHEVAIYTAKTE